MVLEGSWAKAALGGGCHVDGSVLGEALTLKKRLQEQRWVGLALEVERNMEPPPEAPYHPQRSSLPGACPFKTQPSLLLFLVIKSHRSSVSSSPCTCGPRRRDTYGSLGVRHGRGSRCHPNCRHQRPSQHSGRIPRLFLLSNYFYRRGNFM